MGEGVYQQNLGFGHRAAKHKNRESERKVASWGEGSIGRIFALATELRSIKGIKQGIRGRGHHGERGLPAESALTQQELGFGHRAAKHQGNQTGNQRGGGGGSWGGGGIRRGLAPLLTASYREKMTR